MESHNSPLRVFELQQLTNVTIPLERATRQLKKCKTLQQTSAIVQVNLIDKVMVAVSAIVILKRSVVSK